MYSTELGYDIADPLASNDMIVFDENSTFYPVAQQLGSWNQLLLYIQKYFYYDYSKVSFWVQNPYAVPDIENCFKTRRGTAFELSALLVAMARICKIPAIYAVGRNYSKPYAWVELDGDILDPAAMVTRNRSELEYIAEKFY